MDCFCFSHNKIFSFNPRPYLILAGKKKRTVGVLKEGQRRKGRRPSEEENG